MIPARRAQADSRHTPTLQVLVENVIAEVQIPREDFYPTVASVHHVQVVITWREKSFIKTNYSAE